MKLLLLLLIVSCNNQVKQTPLEVSLPKPVTIAVDAKQLYLAKCAKCHNTDPTKQGSIGPDIANSSYDLLENKTQHRTYPSGYTPKRKTKIMPKILLNEEQLKALEIFLKR